MARTIDTLELYERFKAANLDDKAAKEIAEVIKEIQQKRLDDSAVKADIVELKGEIKAVEQRLKYELRLYFIILLFAIILMNPKALELISKILGIVK